MKYASNDISLLIVLKLTINKSGVQFNKFVILVRVHVNRWMIIDHYDTPLYEYNIRIAYGCATHPLASVLINAIALSGGTMYMLTLHLKRTARNYFTIKFTNRKQLQSAHSTDQLTIQPRKPLAHKNLKYAFARSVNHIIAARAQMGITAYVYSDEVLHTQLSKVLIDSQTKTTTRVLHAGNSILTNWV